MKPSERIKDLELETAKKYSFEVAPGIRKMMTSAEVALARLDALIVYLDEQTDRDRKLWAVRLALTTCASFGYAGVGRAALKQVGLPTDSLYDGLLAAEAYSRIMAIAREVGIEP